MSDVIKIMIAEDFPILLEEMAEVIDAQPDMQVVGMATSGREMIELAKNTAYDFILMDIEMEHKTAGIKATEEIRDANPEAKIIFLTVHEEEEMILTAMGAGAVNYIVKGSPDEDILARIRSANKGQPMLDEEIQGLVMQEYTRLQKSEQSLLFFINNIANLTKAERELISYLLKKMTVREIAKARSVEIGTVKSQINRMLKKLNATRTKEIVKTINDLNLTHLF